MSTTQEALNTPYVHSWNIGFQREIATNTVIEARYFGNHSTRWRGYDLNEINIFENGFVDESRHAQRNLEINRAAGVDSFENRGLAGQVPLPMFEAAFGGRGGQGPVDPGAGFANQEFITSLSQGTAGALASELASNSMYLCRMVGSDLEPCQRLGFNASGSYPINVFQANPFAAGSNIRLMTDEAFANYHGLQLEFRRRYSKGFTLTANYTFAKTLGDLFADSTNATRDYITLRNKELDRAPSVFDIRHAFQAYWTLALPFGGEHKLASGNGVIDRIIGGWSLSGITRWQSGKPFRLISGRNTFNGGESGVILNGLTRDELQGMINLRSTDDGLVYFVDERLIGPDGRANAELVQSPTTPGEHGDFVYLRTPSTITTDLALHKNIPIRGRANLTIYVEALNAFNHPNFLVGGTGPDVSINSTTFGQTTDVTAPRNVQIRVKFTF